nr:hypothetical protein CFP56_07769 [Quercus suber]
MSPGRAVARMRIPSVSSVTVDHEALPYLVVVSSPPQPWRLRSLPMLDALAGRSRLQRGSARSRVTTSKCWETAQCERPGCRRGRAEAGIGAANKGATGSRTGGWVVRRDGRRGGLVRYGIVSAEAEEQAPGKQIRDGIGGIYGSATLLEARDRRSLVAGSGRRGLRTLHSTKYNPDLHVQSARDRPLSVAGLSIHYSSS